MDHPVNLRPLVETIIHKKAQANGKYNIWRFKIKEIYYDFINYTQKHQKIIKSAAFVLTYGIMLNIIATTALALPLTPQTILACGLAWWFVSEEIPGVIRRCH